MLLSYSSFITIPDGTDCWVQSLGLGVAPVFVGPENRNGTLEHCNPATLEPVVWLQSWVIELLLLLFRLTDF